MKLKYHADSNHSTVHTVCWNGFAIPTHERFGAEKLAQELNSLDGQLFIQTDVAKGALKQVEELKALNEASEKRIQALQSLAVTDNQHIQRLLDAIEASQSVLRAYIEPGQPVTAETSQHVLSTLLGVLDDRKLVTLCRGLRSSEPIGGPINTTPHGKPVSVATNVTGFGQKLVIKCAENLNDWENADAQITFDHKHWTNVSIEGEFFVALSDGKTSWLRKHIQEDRVVYSTNAHSVIKLITANVSETRLVKELDLMRVPSLSKPKTRRALVQAIEILEDSGTQSDAKAAKRLRKLLR